MEEKENYSLKTQQELDGAEEQSASNHIKKNTSPSPKLPTTVWVVFHERLGQPAIPENVFSTLTKVKKAYPSLEQVSDHCYANCDRKGNGIKAIKVNFS